jgi:hypothetical protein
MSSSLFKEVVNAFTSFDHNNNGVIDREELFMMMEVLDSSWTPGKMELLWNSMDVDDSGSIQYEEFLRWIFQGMGDDEQTDFREAVSELAPQLDAAHFEGAVTIEAKDKSGDVVYGPSEMLGSTAVSLLRRRIKTSLGKPVGCLIQADGIPLRDSFIIGAYSDGSHLSVTVVSNTLSLLTPNCIKELLRLKAITTFGGNDCIRVGRAKPLRIGQEAAEFMLFPDGRVFAKGYRCLGYVDPAVERNGNPRSWVYEMAEGTFTITDLDKCIVEITWRRRAERRGRDAGRGNDPIPLEVALDAWEAIEEVDEVDEKLVPLVAGVASILQIANDWLKIRQPSKAEVEDPDAKDEAPKGSMDEDVELTKIRDPLGGVPMPEVSREVLYELDMDEDTVAYWSHGVNDDGPYRKSTCKATGY